MRQNGESADVVICGAGIAGIATAYFLTQRHDIRNVAIVDNRPPLSLTSDKSSEGYRNWWPGPGDAMIRLMSRSIDLLEKMAAESNNRFHLNKRGYVYLTADPKRAEEMRRQAIEIAQLGAGPLRTNGDYTYSATETYDSKVHGADFLQDPGRIRAAFPFLTNDTLAMLHARRCGWLSAQQLGMYLLEEARAAGAYLINGRVTGVAVHSNHLQAVRIQSGSTQRSIDTKAFVIAAGPLLQEVANLMDVNLPIYNEPHSKIAFEDREGIIDRDAPLMIWNDPIRLPWSDAEREELAAYQDTSWLLDEFPPGLHFRPEGGPGSQTVLALWPYHIMTTEQPVWPLQLDDEFVEVVMRGLSRMIPGLSIYLERMGRPTIDGGYYTKTIENRPLICPLPISGAYVIGALSGYGIMGAPAAAELLSAHIVQTDLPTYAKAFDLARYEDPAYRKLLTSWSPTAGQL